MKAEERAVVISDMTTFHLESSLAVTKCALIFKILMLLWCLNVTTGREILAAY